MCLIVTSYYAICHMWGKCVPLNWHKYFFLKNCSFFSVTLSHAHSVVPCASFVKTSVRFSPQFSRNSIIVCLYFGLLVSGESVVADVTRKYHLRIHTPRNSMWVRQQAGRPNYYWPIIVIFMIHISLCPLLAHMKLCMGYQWRGYNN